MRHLTSLLFTATLLALPHAATAQSLTCTKSSCVATIPVVHDTVIKVVRDTLYLPAKPAPTPTPVPTPTPPASSGTETLAELPRVFLDTRMPATTGRVIPASTSAELTAALVSAQPGDAIALANGVTFTGNFTLTAKTGTGWITIRPADVSQLPAEGVRMTPTLAAAARLPKIVTPTNLGGFNTVNGAHHFRIVGVEITNTVANTGLVRFGDSGTGQSSLAQVPHDLVIDRSYLHGNGTQPARRCVALNSASSAVIDSWLSMCVEKGSDAQAIWGANGPGPFKIVNNYLEGSGENIMFGGSDPTIPNLVPSDIEIRRNHITKPRSYAGLWTVKNLFESKNSQRVLVEGNVMDGNWKDAQGGAAINLKVANQSGGCPWCTTQDITFRYNIVRNIGSGFVLSGTDPGVSVHAKRVTVMHNLLETINASPFLGDGRGMLVSNDPTDFTVLHNTIVTPTAAAVYYSVGAAPPVRLSIRDNVIGGGQYGVKGDGLAAGSATIAAMGNATFLGNVVSLANAKGYPTGNCYPQTLTLTSDFKLSPSSPCKGTATDGRDPGADIDAIAAATAGVIVP